MAKLAKMKRTNDIMTYTHLVRKNMYIAIVLLLSIVGVCWVFGEFCFWHELFTCDKFNGIVFRTIIHARVCHFVTVLFRKLFDTQNKFSSSFSVNFTIWWFKLIRLFAEVYALRSFVHFNYSNKNIPENLRYVQTMLRNLFNRIFCLAFAIESYNDNRFH